MRINVRLSLATTLHADGPTSAAKLESAANQMGISRHDLRKAATSLGVETGSNVWRLPSGVIPFKPRGGELCPIPEEGEAA
jgi:hypothetical protein